MGWLMAQAEADPASWIDLLLGPLGLLVFLLITVWAFATRRVISRGSYDEIVRDRDHWRQVALDGLTIAQKGVEVVKEKV